MILVFIGAASEPKLSVVSAERGGVTLQCEASCWLPELEITFLDDQGKNIPADDPRRLQDTNGQYTVTRRVTLQAATNRFKFSFLLKLKFIFCRIDTLNSV